MSAATRIGSQLQPHAGRVLGIDPGLTVTGYAVVESTRTASRGMLPLVVEAGVIRPRAGESLETRLVAIHRELGAILDEFRPEALALEQVHSRVRNPRTSILMAHARGVIMLAAAQRNVPVAGYAPSRIKKTLTGSGRAPKDQMQHAVQTELGLDRLPEPHDVADACAVALCHFQIERNRRAILGA